MAITSLNTTMRITGLVSNMDTDTIVKNLMQIEQYKLNKQLRSQTTMQWRQDALKSVSTDMKSFKSTFLTALGADGMNKSSAYTSYNVTLTGSKKDAVNITAGADAAYTKVVVNKIAQLASGATTTGSKVSAAGQTELSEGNYVKLGDLNFANELFTGTKTVQQQVKNANGDLAYEDELSGNIYYQLSDGSYVDANDDPVDVSGMQLTAHMEDVQVPDDTIKFSINGVDFEFTKDTTLAQMFSAVNNSKAGVTMSYSRLTDSFTISTRETGANTTLTIENQHGNAFGGNSAFGIKEYGVTDENGVLLRGETAKQGQNAVIYINETRVERSANNFSIDGITYTLNYVTDPADDDNFDPANAVTANLSKNIDASVEKITNFINGYNTMVNKLYSLVTEKKNSKYYALTDDEKAEMTESQIKEWEDLAKSGLLRNDRDIQNVLSNMRTAFYTTIEGAGLSAQDIGLRTAYGSRSGEITINESDLRAALERDSDAVMRVFMGNPSSDDPADAGLITRLTSIIDTYTQKTQYNTLSSLEKDLTKLADKISEMEDRMETLAERYYAKYAAMETALSKLQSQTNWISSMLGTSSSS